ARGITTDPWAVLNARLARCPADPPDPRPSLPSWRKRAADDPQRKLIVSVPVLSQLGARAHGVHSTNRYSSTRSSLNRTAMLYRGDSAAARHPAEERQDRVHVRRSADADVRALALLAPGL